jgi:hypothetical protein
MEMAATLMRDPLLTDLFHALDLFVAERLPDSSFVAVTPPPKWLTQFLVAATDGGPVTIAQAFPYLDSFLSDAETFWQDGTESPLVSGPFTVAGQTEEVLLRASALNVGVHSLLVLARLRGDADVRPLLQHARENALEHERIVKHLDALKEPLKTLSRLTRELLETDLTSAQRALAEGINVASVRVQGVVAGPT